MPTGPRMLVPFPAHFRLLMRRQKTPQIQEYFSLQLYLGEERGAVVCLPNGNWCRLIELPKRQAALLAPSTRRAKRSRVDWIGCETPGSGRSKSSAVYG